MPFLNIMTNVSVSNEKENSIKSEIGKAIEVLSGKSEDWLMVNFEPESHLYFQGSSNPCLMAELTVYGGAKASELEKFTGLAMDIFNNYLGIPKDRMYIRYASTDQWGWNGNNF